MELKSYDIFPKVLTVSAGRANEIFDVIENFTDGKKIPIVESNGDQVIFWFSEFKVICYLDDQGLAKEKLIHTLTEEKTQYDHDARLKLATETYKRSREKFLEGR